MRGKTLISVGVNSEHGPREVGSREQLTPQAQEVFSGFDCWIEIVCLGYTPRDGMRTDIATCLFVLHVNGDWIGITAFAAVQLRSNTGFQFDWVLLARQC